MEEESKFAETDSRLGSGAQVNKEWYMGDSGLLQTLVLRFLHTMELLSQCLDK